MGCFSSPVLHSTPLILLWDYGIHALTSLKSLLKYHLLKMLSLTTYIKDQHSQSLSISIEVTLMKFLFIKFITSREIIYFSLLPMSPIRI